MKFSPVTACKKRKDEESPLLNDCLHEKVEKIILFEIQFFRNEIIILFSGIIGAKPLGNQAA